MKYETILASSVAALDSDVREGGGADDTAALQRVLDAAGERSGVRLIMDGAALVRGLKLHSNTTIECLSKDCGFYLASGSNRAIVENADRDFYAIRNRNISLLGGTYNHNAAGQRHHVPAEDPRYLFGGPKSLIGIECPGCRMVIALEFIGVENLLVRDVTIRDQRTWAMIVGNFQNVTIEDGWIELPGHAQCSNQDGYHFWGPGRFLTIRNVGGRTGDDFMNLGPDEHDGESSITDVLIDGVFLDDADQAIRMLSRGAGRLDRVTVRDVSGTYRSFGFYLNPWFGGERYGSYGNICFENIDLRAGKPNYDYRPPVLFSAGGDFESLTFRNIRHHLPCDARTVFELGLPFCDTKFVPPENNPPRIRSVTIDGFEAYEQGDAAKGTEYVQLFDRVDRLTIRDVSIAKEGHGGPSGCLVAMKERGSAGVMRLHDIAAGGLAALVDDETKADVILSSDIARV